MFPVLSLLRRASVKVIYADLGDPFLLVREGQVFAKLRTEGRWITEAGDWAYPGKLAPFLCISAEASTPKRVASLLARQENQLARKINVSEIPVALIVGKEEEATYRGSLERGLYVRRTVRMAILRGPWRLAPSAHEIEREGSAEGAKPKARFRKLPRGTVRESR